MRAFLSALIILVLVGCNSASDEVPVEETPVKVIADTAQVIVEEVDSIETKVEDTDSVELNNSIPSHFSDIRDGKEYKIVKIGEQIWMAENLAYKPDSGICWAYDNDNTNVAQYGYLYNWNTAKKVCPVGWHLPSDEEWSVLTDYLGGVEVAGTKMKSSSGWNDNGNGTNESGFNAFPGGYLQVQDSENFYSVGSYGYWWSSSESGDRNKSMAWLLLLLKNNGMSSYYYYKADGYSVRCIKD